MPPTPDNTVPWSKRPTFFLVPCLDFGASTASVAAGAGACSEYESCSGGAEELAAKLASRCKQAHRRVSAQSATTGDHARQPRRGWTWAQYRP